MTKVMTKLIKLSQQGLLYSANPNDFLKWKMEELKQALLEPFNTVAFKKWAEKNPVAYRKAFAGEKIDRIIKMLNEVNENVNAINTC